MLTSTDFSGLLTPRFFQNFLPIPATNRFPLGKKTPDFLLLDTQNQQIKLSNYYGQKPVILDFTRIFTEKQYCPLCFPHIKALNDAYDQFIDRGVDVLMITSTDTWQSRVVARDLGLKMPLLIDPNCFVFRSYQVGQALGAPLPAQFVLDQDGKLQFRHLFSFLSPNASVETLLKVIDSMNS